MYLGKYKAFAGLEEASQDIGRAAEGGIFAEIQKSKKYTMVTGQTKEIIPAVVLLSSKISSIFTGIFPINSMEAQMWIFFF